MSKKKRFGELKPCSFCKAYYQADPPDDPQYSIARDKPTSDDYKLIQYYCDNNQEKHRNVKYWEKPQTAEELGFIVFESVPQDEFGNPIQAISSKSKITSRARYLLLHRGLSR